MLMTLILLFLLSWLRRVYTRLRGGHVGPVTRSLSAPPDRDIMALVLSPGIEPGSSGPQPDALPLS
jgi:hypothetical protein